MAYLQILGAALQAAVLFFPLGNLAQTADWANLGRYVAANQQLPASAAGWPRVVRMGNSITDA